MRIFFKTFKNLLLLSVTLLIGQSDQSLQHVSLSSSFNQHDNQGSIYGGLSVFMTTVGLQLNQYDPTKDLKIIVGNNVNCQINSYYLTDTTLVCDIPPGNYGEQKAFVKLLVQGNDVGCTNFQGNQCYVYFTKNKSTFVKAIVPNNIVAGADIIFRGYFNIENSNQVTSIRVGGYLCDVVPDIQMRKYSRTEHLKCKLRDEIPVGAYDVSLKTAVNIGSSLIHDSARTHEYGNEFKKFDVRVFPRIDSLSSNKGFVDGREIVVKGAGFGSDPNAISAGIDNLKNTQFSISEQQNGISIEILSVQEDELKLRINKDERQNFPKWYIGGSGFKVNRYNNTYLNIKTFLNYQKQQQSWQIGRMGNKTLDYIMSTEILRSQKFYVEFFEGVFVAPVTGTYKFFTSADSQGMFKFMEVTRDQPIDKSQLQDLCPLKQGTEFREYFKIGQDAPCEREFEQGHLYFFQFIHREDAGRSNFSVAIAIPKEVNQVDQNNTNYLPKIQKLQITNNPVKEKLVFIVNNAISGTFFIQLVTPYYTYRTENIAFNATHDEFHQKLKKLRYWNFTSLRENLNSDGNVLSDGANESEIRGHQWTVEIQIPRYFTNPVTIIANNLVESNNPSSPQLVAEVQVLIPPSPVLGGTFKLKANGKETPDLPVLIDDLRLSNELNKIFGTTANIEIQHGQRNQRGRQFLLIFEGMEENPNIEISEKNLIGNEADVKFVTIQEFSTDFNFYRSIPTELLRTVHSEPQLNISVAGLSAVCPNNKNDFKRCEYQTLRFDELSPEEQQQIPSFASWSYSVNTNKISFVLSSTIQTPQDIENLEITFGKKHCQIISETINLPNFECQVGRFAAGSWKPRIHVPGFGFVNPGQSQAYLHPIIISEIDPSDNQVIETSIGGGLMITIKGDNLTQKAEITVGDQDCVVQQKEMNSFTEIQCRLPAQEKQETKEFELTIEVNGIKSTDYIVRYSVENSPQVQSLNNHSLSPVLKEYLIIQGNKFNPDFSKNEVIIRNDEHTYECTVTEASDQRIKCKQGGAHSGVYEVIVNNKDLGYSINTQNSNSHKLTYEITVSNINSNSGSILGGTDLIITGNNFSSKLTQNTIVIGDQNAFCVVTESSDTQIKCTTTAPEELTGEKENFVVLQRIVEQANCPEDVCTFHFSEDATPRVTSAQVDEFYAGQTMTITYENTNSVFKNYELFFYKIEGQKVFKDQKFEVHNLSQNPGVSNQVFFKIPILPTGQYQLVFRIPQDGFATFIPQIDNATGIPIRIDRFKNEPILKEISNRSSYKNGIEFYLRGNGFEEGMVVKVGKDNCAHQEFINPTEFFCRTNPINESQEITIMNHDKTKTYSCNQCKIDFIDTQFAFKVDDQNLVFTGDSIIINGSFIENPGLINQIRYVLRKTQDSDSSSYFEFYNGTFSNNKISFTFVPVGEYHLEILSDGSFAEIQGQNQIEVNFAEITTDQPARYSSFLGGSEIKMMVKGLPDSDFGSQVHVRVCGVKAELIDNAFDSILFVAPPILNKKIVEELKIPSEPKILIPEKLTFKQGNFMNYNKLIYNVGYEVLNDDNVKTYFGGYPPNCELNLNFGQGNIADINRLEFVPNPMMRKDQFQGLEIVGIKSDGTEVILYEFDNQLVINWNFVDVDPLNSQFRRVIVRGSYCRLSELKVYGNLYLKQFNEDFDFKECEVEIEVNGRVQNLRQNLIYNKDSTAIVTEINPTMGTSAGGTQVVIKGENFGNDSIVIFNGHVCQDIQVNDQRNQITCTTDKRSSEIEENSIEIRSDRGLASTGNHMFYYVDRWSENRTWGNEAPPREGESVHVPKGQTLLVDVSTPLLKAVVVEGTIIWADEKDQTFDAHYLFVNKGKMVIGTPEEPRQHKLTMTLHGKRYDQTLPGMGNKLIGVRQGEIDIHGQERTYNWTFLENTANSGDLSITLNQQVDWKVGEWIVIAPTGLRSFEFEKRQILEITHQNGTSKITFEVPLLFTHVSESIDLNGQIHDIRAEVALLSRNIVIQGNKKSESNRYGVHIMLTGQDTNVRGRFSNFMMKNCGQVSMMGRYPIHFHMTGNSLGSYIRGIVFENSFNRGTTLHGVNHLEVSHNVYYKHLGHGIFFEDGIEQYNKVHDNLIMRTKVSSSLLHSDLTPAAMWITRPKNYIENNRAVGSQSFGFWYDIPSRPTGPSGVGNDNICPSGESLGSFKGNVAHSNKTGLIIYPVFIPREKPCESLQNRSKRNLYEDNPPKRAIFENTLFYSNKQGIFARAIGAVTFDNFTFISNVKVLTYLEPQYDDPELGPILSNSSILGRSILTEVHEIQTSSVFNTGKKNAQTFVNIYVKDVLQHENNVPVFLTPCAECDPINPESRGFARVHLRQITLDNVQGQLIKWKKGTNGKDAIYDEDGSLSKYLGFEQAEERIITPFLPHLKRNGCAERNNPQLSMNTLFCDNSIPLRRIDLFTDDNFKGLDLKINETGKTEESQVKYINSKVFKGWSFISFMKKSLDLSFSQGIPFKFLKLENSHNWKMEDQLRLNFSRKNPDESFRVEFSGIDQENQKVNKFEIQNMANEIWDNSQFGDYFVHSANILETEVSGERIGKVTFHVNSCNGNCLPPAQTAQVQETKYWNKVEDWEGQGIPQPGDDVTIPANWVMILNQNTGDLNKITIHGLLKVQNDDSNPEDQDIQMSAKIVNIRKNGILTIGEDLKPYQGKFTLKLRGTTHDREISLPSVPDNLTARKALIVSGKFVVETENNPKAIVRLASNALKNNNQIELRENIENLKVGDEIVISSTSQSTKEHEIHIVNAIDIVGKVLTLNENLKYNHYGTLAPKTIKKKTLDMAAEVASLRRNVNIIGTDEDDWGCTVLVTEYNSANSNGSNVKESGNIDINGVRFRNCGQRDTLTGALNLQRLKTNNNRKQNIRNSIFSDNLGVAVSMENARNINFQGNVIVDAQQYGIYMKNINNSNINNNMVVGVKSRKWYKNDSVWDLAFGIYFEGGDWTTSQIFANHNIVSGSEFFGFVVPGYNCNGQNRFMGNVAHSNRAGWLPRRANQCQKYSHFTAYKNYEQGFVTRFKVREQKVRDFVLSDNGNSIAMNGGGQNPSVQIEDSLIVGKGQENCSFCYSPSSANRTECKTNGFITSLFETRDFTFDLNEYYMPLHNVTDTSFEMNGFQTLKNVHFENFKTVAGCGSQNEAYVLRVNEFSYDTSPLVKLIGTTKSNVDEKFFMKFPNIRRAKKGFCQMRNCTGVLNVLIDDESGMFNNNDEKRMYFGPNRQAAQNENCAARPLWNGYECKPQYASLQMMKSPKLSRNPIISPITFTIPSEDTKPSEFRFKNVIDNESKFSTLLRTNSQQKVHFSQSLRQDNFFQLRTVNAGDYVVFEVHNDEPTTLIVKRNNVMIPPVTLQPGDTIENFDWSEFKNTCGSNIFIPKTSTLLFLMNNNCAVTIHQTSSIELTEHLEVSVSEFYENMGTSEFIDHLAALLNIHPSRIKIVGVEEGSTYLTIQIYQEDINDQSAEFDDEDNQDLSAYEIKIKNELISLLKMIMNNKKIQDVFGYKILDADGKVIFHHKIYTADGDSNSSGSSESDENQDSESSQEQEQDQATANPNKYCRFYSLDSYILIDKSQIQESLGETVHVEFNCPFCKHQEKCIYFKDLYCKDPNANKQECDRAKTESPHWFTQALKHNCPLCVKMYNYFHGLS